MMRTATEWVSSLKDLSLRNFMWKQVPMANITNRDTGEYESGMTRAGSVVVLAGWLMVSPVPAQFLTEAVTIYYNLHSNIM